MSSGGSRRLPTHYLAIEETESRHGIQVFPSWYTASWHQQSSVGGSSQFQFDPGRAGDEVNNLAQGTALMSQQSPLSMTFGARSTLGQVGHFGLELLEHIWNLPNTILGGAWLLLNLPFGGTVTLADGAIHLENAPFQADGSNIALGDVVVYGGNRGDSLGPIQPGVTAAGHEIHHVLQGRALGPLYIPANVLGWTASLLHFAFNQFSASGWMSPIHGPLNFMETGPLSVPPRTWP